MAKYLVHISAMRLKLAKFLLLIITITAIVMPIHAYAHGMTEIEDNHSLKIDTGHNTDGVSKSCGHCCHFLSHSLGLMQKSSSIVDLQVKDTLNYQGQNYASYKQPPPYHPPISS